MDIRLRTIMCNPMLHGITINISHKIPLLIDNTDSLKTTLVTFTPVYVMFRRRIQQEP